MGLSAGLPDVGRAAGLVAFGVGPVQMPRMMLLCRNPAWHEAVLAELATIGEETGRYLLTVAASAREAMAELAGMPASISHLLLEPSAADDMLTELLSLTSGEAGPGPALVLLGGPHAAVAAHLAVMVPDAPPTGWLRQALRTWQSPALAGDRRGLSGEAELRGALAEGALRMRYQPVVQMSDRRPVSIEALARMEHPLRGRMLPEDFLPGLEAAGLGQDLTRAVIDLCLADWDADRMAELDLRLGVNLPLDILLLPCLPDWLDQRCAMAGLPPSRLVLELLETQPVVDVQALGCAATTLRDRGYQLAIDDVGPAQRDPMALLHMPFDTLKLDKDVVREAADSAEARGFLRRTIDLAHGAGMVVVAEGVEDLEIWARMRSLGADQGQGYAIARPLPPVAVPLWHHAWCAQTEATARRRMPDRVVFC